MAASRRIGIRRPHPSFRRTPDSCSAGTVPHPVPGCCRQLGLATATPFSSPWCAGRNRHGWFPRRREPIFPPCWCSMYGLESLWRSPRRFDHRPTLRVPGEQGLSKVAQHCGRWANGVVEGMDGGQFLGQESGSGAGMTRVTLLRLWKGPTEMRAPLTTHGGCAIVTNAPRRKPQVDPTDCMCDRSSR